MEAPLAGAGSPFGRLWNPLDIAVSAVVDTDRNGPLTVTSWGFRRPGIPRDGLPRRGRETVFQEGAYA